ncbi:ornithine decarboxylase-like [Cynoglossus semilaevis]|uniref:ornithine decarboxylase-like n=1 Tax=Cynoglossus semilaevis TaxID=244447 RepID=UPI0004983305|nr:ornithine decarboxylase-like [Cynoglossus semilaevis]
MFGQRDALACDDSHKERVQSGPRTDKEKDLKITAVINPALDKYFPADSGVRLIAEPGTFYVESCCTLIVNVIAKKVIQEKNKETSDRNLVYYVNDGLHTSFLLNIFKFHYILPRPHRKIKKDEVFFRCCIWGQTCSSNDIISERCHLPELQVGDWLLFENRGAYSFGLSSTFNGFPKPYIYFTMPHSAQLVTQ